MVGRRQSTALRHRDFIALLLALGLAAAQVLFAAHDATSHTHQHAAECQICAHGSGAGHALPAPVVFFPPRATDTRGTPVSPSLAISHRYQTPTARAPPPDSPLTVSI